MFFYTLPFDILTGVEYWADGHLACGKGCPSAIFLISLFSYDPGYETQIEL